MPEFEIEFQDDDIFTQCFDANQKITTKFLNKYSTTKLNKLFETYEILPRLRNLNVQPMLEIDTKELYSHHLYIYERDQCEPEKAIVRLIIGPQPKFFGNEKHKTVRGMEKGRNYFERKLQSDLKVLDLKWISMQNTKAKFTKKRPRFPGQKYPGFGMMSQVIKVLFELVDNDGIANEPMHFHNAVFSKSFKFVNPSFQGWFDSLREDLGDEIQKQGLAKVSWAIFYGGLRDKEGNKIEWEGEDMVQGKTEKVSKYFQSKGYLKYYNASKFSRGFYIDWESVKEKMSKH
ncbi:hypothetical protein M0813_18141 [Anaeramoeba flamelloides]|uniref:Uncharacterized protein n=1 Tax=Anaeramoeba flamelloides TaxID=1746091 RepID=A0AAV7ZFW7_9EUKA|nr:hypothetical protein M0812_16173 [Anaeramoeba flamelloides]KAJ6248038.1 hypothetical protein M0813_18141 [Anaeramoeba flamelloides]